MEMGTCPTQTGLPLRAGYQLEFVIHPGGRGYPPEEGRGEGGGAHLWLWSKGVHPWMVSAGGRGTMGHKWEVQRAVLGAALPHGSWGGPLPRHSRAECRGTAREPWGQHELLVLERPGPEWVSEAGSGEG